ncbi:hypothetical protein [Szabonella alba]|uniref:Uncharacterized protein n=1 Tax=Szabonella alba TaxID=2804194 RepID=A0A8K0V5K3_9RHOB|nr:hypothetical protein [Szabonella alba]MBL4915847.1 hypothetical protein [Szabonella alba]
MAAQARIILGLTAAFALSGPALAGKTPVGGVGGFPVFVPVIPTPAPTPDPTTGGTGSAATSANAAQVASQIEAATSFCASLPGDAYTLDCMAERLDRIARDMPATADLAEARSQLAEASRELSDLARANADSALPPARARIPGGIATGRPLVPVNPTRQAAVKSQAAAILERTETLLLRSSGGAPSIEGYRRIAGAVGSAKVLLRST